MDTPLLNDKTKQAVSSAAAGTAACLASTLVDGINSAANGIVYASNVSATIASNAIASLTPAASAVVKKVVELGTGVIALIPDKQPKTPFAATYVASDGNMTLHVHGLPLSESFELLTFDKCEEARLEYEEELAAFEAAQALTWENISDAEADEAKSIIRCEPIPDFILEWRRQAQAQAV